jgi:hypothetical protein
MVQMIMKWLCLSKTNAENQFMSILLDNVALIKLRTFFSVEIDIGATDVDGSNAGLKINKLRISI